MAEAHEDETASVNDLSPEEVSRIIHSHRKVRYGKFRHLFPYSLSPLAFPRPFPCSSRCSHRPPCWRDERFICAGADAESVARNGVLAVSPA